MKKLLTGVLMAGSVIANAGTPVFYFQALTQTDITIAKGEVKKVVYKVRNQSTKPHNIAMRKMVGVNEVGGAGSCIDKGRLEAGQSCFLNLEIVGDEFIGLEDRSPRVCADGTVLMCYTPSEAQLLKVTKV